MRVLNIDVSISSFFLLSICLLISCQKSYDEKQVSLASYQIEEGFELSAIASEPLLNSPVAIDFDAQGRIWVAQMPGYMNDMQGSDEDKPVGSIKILEDLDNDGVIDHAKTFLDGLVMPRALAHVYGGLLYAEPPFLYFVEIEDDKPVNRIVVDSIYAAVRNPQHQPNGLLLNVDNWIYNAKSNFRYQRKNGIWKKEPTTFRGQWGISHDNFGRLYYNNNSQQLRGDHVLPNLLVRNKHFTPKVGVRQLLTKDQRVYPLHATSVNRGYAEGVLNADSILVNTTAAAGLVVYRGGAFSKDYNQNVFVSIPEGNLIKRNILSFSGDSTSAKQAWQDKEFLASTDEGFRPVSLNNGPDGSLYIVDMHLGMIGHHAYLSPYFKKKTEGTKLDTVVNYGRILKVSPSNKKTKTPIDFDLLTSTKLVELLKHQNGWLRNRAQHQLINKEDKSVVPNLKEILRSNQHSLAQIHALYTLEGLNALDFDLLREVAMADNSDVIAHAVVLLEQFASKENGLQAHTLFENLLNRNDIVADLYVSSTLGTWLPYASKEFFQNVLFVLKKYNEKPIFKEAILSGLEGNEKELLNALHFVSYADDEGFVAQLNTVVENQINDKTNPILTRKFLNEDNRTAGAKMYYQICASCHGSNGEGLEGLAPPLQKSEHVANTERLALIILHGIQGPIQVQGELYNFNLAMPGLIRNENISDKDIADIIAYVSNAFSDTPKSLKKEKITALRALIPKSGTEYTEAELLAHSEE